ncbi:MAG: Pr6Pr family membrane protein, partial [Microbacterium sp.]|uniref:Pr6Pr family membrane protein n=1 Tax=Microbacterium sp. TaxID=51671 RepID=UPI001ACDE191
MTRTETWTRVWDGLRAVAAALALAAIIAQLVRTVGVSLDAKTEYGRHVGTVVTNFFSFFTIESNLAAVVTLLIGAIWAWTKGRDAAVEPRWFAVLLVCVSTYMIVTGIVYNLLLRGIQLSQGATVAWSNEVLHVVIPLFLLADVLCAPRRRALPWSTAWISVIYPIVWAVYTLLRAPLVVSPATGNPYWYPYPFLDPHQPGGYLAVVAYIVGIAIAIIGVGLLV